jgi:hypothetical protein
MTECRLPDQVRIFCRMMFMANPVAVRLERSRQA